MSIINNAKEEIKHSEQYKNIKQLLKDKNLNPKNSKDLKYLLNLTLRKGIKKFNLDYLLIFLLKFFNKENEKIFYEYFFQSCKLDKLKTIKILLDKGLSVNFQNDLGETPLHIAISKNDIKLIKLLIKYEPNTNLSTFKDGFTAMNYAEIRGNKEIIKLIEDLTEKNNKKLIKSEIIEFINKDMNNLNSSYSDNISLFVNTNNIDEIQNYNGEIIPFVTNEEKSSDSIDKNNSSSVYINNINLVNNKKDNMYNITQKILNESELRESISPKNTIKVNNYSNHINNINNINNISNISNIYNNNGILYNENQQNEDCIYDIELGKNYLKKLKKNLTSPLKKKDDIFNSYNNKVNIPSCLHSLTTSATLNNKEQFESPLIKNRSLQLKDKKMELSKFMLDIKLPKIYAKNLVENGFDDLEVLIMQTKNGTAISDNNLKDIGISSPGDRAKILIHLEEMAGNFPFLLEKNIIYSNKIEENNTLYKFLTSIKLAEYIKIFYKKGYYNVELLLIQMVSKYPINENILKNDFGINNIGVINRIIQNLSLCSEKYIKKLKNKTTENNYYKSCEYNINPYVKTCDGCLIF